MAIPEAVQKQVDEANKIYQQVYQPVKDEGKKPGEGELPVKTGEEEPGKTEEKTSQEALKAPGEEEPSKKEEVVEQQPPTDLNTAIGEIEALRQEVARLQDENTKLVHKFSVLDGKYKAEVKTDVPTLISEIESLKSEIAQLRRGNAVASTGKTVEGDAIRQTLNAQAQEAIKRLTEDIGGDYVNDIQTIFNSIVDNAIKPIETRLNTVQTENTRTARERYVTDLNDLCPDWPQIKDDPRFMIFLEEMDVGSGHTRYDLAHTHMQNGNAEGVAYWYNQFKLQTGWKPATQPSGKDNKSSKDKAKERYIAPAGSPKGGGQPGEGAEKKFIKASELQQFAVDVATGKYKGREEEAKRIKAEHDAAIREGRIIAEQ